MKGKYFINNNEKNMLIKIILDTKSEYIRKQERRNRIVQFSDIDDIEIQDMIQLEDLFYKQELIRFAEPYLKAKEFELFKSAVYNAENIEQFKRFLFKNRNYDYKILKKVLKKIGGIFNEQ